MKLGESTQYCLVFFALAFLCVFTAAGFILAVDPLGIFHNHTLAGFNDNKFQANRFTRMVKPRRFLQANPRLVIFGASYASMGYDPEKVEDADEVYNFGLEGAPWEEIYCAMKFAMNSPKVDHFVISLHPVHMPVVDCDSLRGTENAAFGARIISHLSVDMLVAAFKAVTSDTDEGLNHTKSGLYAPSMSDAVIRNRFRKTLDTYYHTRINNISTDMPVGMEVDGLYELWKEASRKGIRMDVIFNPRHASLEYIDYCVGRRVAAVEFLREYFSQKQDGPVFWAIRAFNKELRYTPKTQPRLYWYDVRHFAPLMGNRMMKDILKDRDEGYHLKKIGRDNMEAYSAYATRHYENLIKNQSVRNFINSTVPDARHMECR